MVEKFDWLERLGSGYFGEVWRARDIALNVEQAVKVISPDKLVNPQNFFHEAQMLKAAEHANVVRVEGADLLPDGRIYVAMELLSKGSFEKEAKGSYVSLRRTQKIMIDVLRGLEHAHSRNILHRDIKPANIMIGPGGEGKLSDFGLAMPAGLDLSTLGVKDYNYLWHKAPEVFAGEPYSVASDIYACGVTLYRIVNGDNFYVPPGPFDVEEAICNAAFPDRGHYRFFVPLALRKLINKALDPDPTERFRSAREMRASRERIPIEKDWNEQALANGKRWTCGWDRKCYEVVLQQVGSTWEVCVKRGPSSHKLKRVTDLCAIGLSRPKAEAKAKRVLTDFVSGKT